MNLNELLKRTTNDDWLKEAVYQICDLELFEQTYPTTESPLALGGQTTWNMPGRVFGQDGGGGEFVLLDDGSIGYNGSEGETGRIAENFSDLLVLLINCSAFQDFSDPRLYESREKLSSYAQKWQAKGREENRWDSDYDKTLRMTSEALNVPLAEDLTDILLKFQAAAMRDPQYTYIFRDGTTETLSEPLISRHILTLN